MITQRSSLPVFDRAAGLPAQRWEAIVMLCRQRRYVAVSELARATGASLPTIQRDLAELDRRAVLRRVRGGAAAIEGSGSAVIPWQQREDRDLAAKRAVAHAAAQRIPKAGLVFLSNGTTVLPLVERLDATQFRQVEFVTNGVPVAQALAERGLRHLLLPGRIVAPVASVVGEHALELLGRLHFDLCVLAFQGLDIKHGISDADIGEATLKAAALRKADRVLGVTDHTKLGRTAAARVAAVDALHELITDEIAAPARRALTRLGVAVETAGRGD